MSELLDNIKSAWTTRSRGSRLLFIGLFTAVLALALAASLWAFRTNYQVLFTDLDARDAGAIVEELKRMKVRYQLAEGGTRILVDRASVHETRLALMGRGVPLSGGVGFEIFDNKDVGMTEYTQRINYQRALQGELARTIMSIDQVRQARVHLVLGETTLFRRQKMKPKASVTLVLKPGMSLGGEQIAGIQRLVAAAVPGLEAGAVTVLDQAGVALSAVTETNEDYAHADGKLRLKKSAEDYFIRKITAVLDRALGPGQAIVSVDVTLNFEEVKRTQQTVVPLRAAGGEDGGAVVRKRQSVYRHGKGSVARTVDGDTSYVNGSSPNLTSTTDVEYEFGRTVEQVVSSAGGIRRVSVGIVVPQMNAEQIQRVQDLVSMIVGYNAARGDAISVQPIDHMPTASPEPLQHAPETWAIPAAPAAGDGRTPLPRISQLWSEPAIALGATGLLAVGLLLGMLTTALRSRRPSDASRSSKASLDRAQRRARLAEIKSWLAAERAKGSA